MSAPRPWTARAVALLEESLKPVPTELNPLDWKRELSPKNDRLVEHLCAMANHAGGGFLVFGIDSATVQPLGVTPDVTQMPNPENQALHSIGILAYGSLIADPGAEIEPLIARRIATHTPFPVEFARLSSTRGGAPTVVPHSSGQPVRAEVLVLIDGVSLDETRSLLWRRETRKEGSGRAYPASGAANAVVIEDSPGFCGLEHVLYTDFNPRGKIPCPAPVALAEAAISSVGRAAPGKDGISYLLGLLEAGIETALTPQYTAEILARTGTSSLDEALLRLQPTLKKGS